MRVNAELGEMTRKQTAEYLGICLNTLEKLSIPRIKIGRFSVYRKSDIESWKNKQVAENTQGKQENADNK